MPSAEAGDWVRRPGCLLVRPGRVGDAGEGDFEAEGFDLADVVGDLAGGGGGV